MLFRKTTTEARLRRARRAWLRAMSPDRGARGLVSLPYPPVLEDRHVEGCELLASRASLVARLPRGARIVEVGVLAGDFSRVILDACSPERLHLIDLDLRSHGIARRFADEVASGCVILHEGDSARVLEEFADESFDAIYIDGDHTYEGVRRDIQVAKRKIRREGLLIFNDYTYWSPVECMPYGVMQAVNELCLDEGWQAVYFALDGFMYCDIAIRRM